jgi:hypothetical protein
MLHVKENNKRRLDIAATYGGKRYLVDISVSATQIKKVGTTAVGKVEAGMAANARYKEKVAKYGVDDVKRLQDILQVLDYHPNYTHTLSGHTTQISWKSHASVRRWYTDVCESAQARYHFRTEGGDDGSDIYIQKWV